KALPTEIRTRQARDFQGKHRAHLAHRDIGHKSLKALPPRHLRSRLSQILVEGADQGFAPAQFPRLLAQGVLALRALPMVENLSRRRLAQVDVGWLAAGLVFNLWVHSWPPPPRGHWGRDRASWRAYWRGARRPVPDRSARGGRAALRSWRSFKASRDGVGARG